MIYVHPAGTPLADDIAEAVARSDIAEPATVWIADTTARTVFAIEGCRSDVERLDAIARFVEMTSGPCIGCGHAAKSHVNGQGLCLVKSCRLCLIYRPAERMP